MTKEQILAEIAAKIDGQGSAIDAGSALPGILRGILEIAVSGGNVQSDWAQTNSAKEDYIKNKPTIPAAQIQSDWEQSDNTKLDFIKNKPTIPAAQVNADWNATEGVAKILNKPTIPQGPLVIEAVYTGSDVLQVDNLNLVYNAMANGRIVYLHYTTSGVDNYTIVLFYPASGLPVAAGRNISADKIELISIRESD